MKRVHEETLRKKTETSQEGYASVLADFSENYTCVEQDEIPPAHWSKHQISVFTAVCRISVQTDSYALISNYREHNKYFVDIAIKTIIAD